MVDSYPLTDLLRLADTPVKTDALLKVIKQYPNATDKVIIANGFQFGFKVGYNGPRFPNNCKNLTSAYEHVKELGEKLEKELNLGRIAGPFSYRPFQNLRLSPIGILEKPSGGWRLIQHLSYPLGKSINSHIDPQYSSVQYTPFDKVLSTIYQTGPGAKMGRMDIKSAFRILILHPDDFELFGFKFNDYFFYDKCLPMGCAASCQLFEKFATFLEWLVRSRTKKDSIEHYLDDFFFIGKSQSDECNNLMSVFREVCFELGVPIAEEKTLGPSCIIIFLGLEIDTIEMVVRIPLQKLNEAREKLIVTWQRKKVTLRWLQSLVGLLNFCAKAIPAARAFNRRFIDAMCGAKQQHHMIRVSVEMKNDIQVWIKFLQQFNGTCKFGDNIWVTNEQLNLYTDSTGNAELGCGVYYKGHWAYLAWPKEWKGTEIMRDMTFLELVPILLALYIFRHEFSNRQIMFHTDNQALVSILNKKSSRSKRVMHLIRPLVLQTMLHGMQFKSRHIEGRVNCIADAISRKQWGRFRRLDPKADAEQAAIPQDFMKLISELKCKD